MERFICIHGHFYQPPRENPWIEAVEPQDPAYPYHDWNEKINAECYAPNALSRILDEKGRIVQITNNYSRISFNFGPTLLSWLENNEQKTYKAIIDSDKESTRRFSGHGSALAQAYNHMILPLADRKDKYTQIFWGIRDFETRFRRAPEGMWLPETAVDLESLDIMADLGIRFTILAPHQARRVRPVGERRWQDLDKGPDTTRAYTLRLPSGRTMAVFFYNGPVSRAVAFENLLDSGTSFAERLLSQFSDEERPQLVHIATDGESYGHHHRFGEMALAYALNYIESNGQARLTIYGEFLDEYPPAYEVEIRENTSWSCAHGIERWRDGCGCNSGSHPGWNQLWRKPLREALDRLRDAVSPLYEQAAASLLKDPWRARDDYIQVILNRSEDNLEDFLGRHAISRKPADRTVILKLLEIQRHAMLMYTSCGWFFDDISGLETVQVIQYAARVVQLAGEVFGRDLEPAFLEKLEQAVSNVPEEGNGRRVYEKMVKTSMADLKKVAAHFAMCSLFGNYNRRVTFYCYSVDLQDYRSSEAGRASLALGRALFTSEVTKESALLAFGVLHLGDHNLNCGVMDFTGTDTYEAVYAEVMGAFASADFPETIRRLDRCFGPATYSLKSLFREEQRTILDRILGSTLANTEAVFRQVYETNAPLMRFLEDTGITPPKALGMTAEFVLNASLREAFEDEAFDVELMKSLLQEAKREGVALDVSTLEFAMRKNLEKKAKRFHENPSDLPRLLDLEVAVNFLRNLPFPVNLWTVQNVCYDIRSSIYPLFCSKAASGDRPAKEWIDHFAALGDKISVRIAPCPGVSGRIRG